MNRRMMGTYDRERNLTSIIPVAVYSTDADGVINWYNDRAVELWGRRPRINDPTERPYCGSFRSYDVHGNLLPPEKCPMALALKEKRPFKNQEICIERPDGSKFAAFVNVDLIPSINGTISGAINVFYSIHDTDKTVIDSQHHDSQWLAAIVESSEDAIISKNLDGTVTSWNKAAEKIYGYSREEMIGRSISIIIPAYRFTEEVEFLERIKLGGKVEHFETTRITKDGRKIIVSLSISPIKDKEGRVIGASKISRNITDKVRLEQKLEEYAKTLAALNKQKDEFIALASHELKTPTTTIKGYLQIIDEEIQQPEYKVYIEKTLKQTEKLTNLICDMLDVTSLQSGGLKMHYSRFDIRELITECVKDIQAGANKHKIGIEGNLDCPTVVGDKKRIKQVFLTLLTNAVKYSPQADKINVNCTAAGEDVVISIQDFGPGIPTDKLEKIFTRFYRIDRTDFSSGLGIGLYIAKEIVTGHKGRIWVESEEGKGATFYIQLPSQLP